MQKNTTPTATQIRPEYLYVQQSCMRDFFRRGAVLFSMLVFGGNWLLFGRFSSLFLVVTFSTITLLMQGFRLHPGLWKPMLFPVFVALFSLLQPGATEYLSTLSQFVNFFAAIELLAVYLNESRSTLIDDLVFLFKLMSYQSLLTFVLGNFGADLFSDAASDIVEARVYKTIGYIFTYHMTAYDTFTRPDGFFFEPGVLQIFLCIYLYISLFEIRSLKHIVLASSGVISTYSTSGAIVMCLLFGYYFINLSITSRFASRSGILIVVSIILAIPFGIYVESNVTEKLSGARAGSFIARQNDFLTALNLIADHPIFGVGFTEQRYKDAVASNARGDPLFSVESSLEIDTTNGALSIIYSIGIPLSIIVYFGLFNQRFFRYKILFALFVIMSLFSQKLFLSVFFLMVFFSGLVGRDKKFQRSLANQTFPKKSGTRSTTEHGSTSTPQLRGRVR